MAREKAAPTRMQRAGNGHSYFLDGEKVPGVTTILSNGIPKGGLVGWAANSVSDFVTNRLTIARNPEGVPRIVADELVADLLEWNRTRDRPTPVSAGEILPRQALGEILANVRYRDLDQASGKGTAVHDLAEKLGRGEEVEVPEELAGHVRSYLRFLEEWEPYDAILERVIVNRRFRYMGKFDMIATFDNLPDWIAERIGSTTGTGLLDIKTSRSGIFSDVALQLEAYRNGETMLEGREEVPMPKVDFVAAIHVRADGYDVIAFDIESERRPTTFEIFLYAKQVGDWLDWKEGPASRIRSESLHKTNTTTTQRRSPE